MSFTAEQRARLADLADVLIPAIGNDLSASQADVGSRGLDLVLTARPDLAKPLQQVLDRADAEDANQAVERLRQSDPAHFAVLAEFAASAYFLNPDVLRSHGYAGQSARAIDPAPDYVEDGLLESVIERGRIYRPTPQADV